MMDGRSNLNNPKMTALLFAVLVGRLGGKVEISQSDIDGVAYDLLEEEMRADGSVEFRLIKRGLRS